MIIHSNKEKWYKERERLKLKASYFYIYGTDIRYILCEKSLFRRPKILGTNTRIKPNDHITDITTKRYGEEFCGSYLFESQYGTFASILTAESVAMLISDLPIYKERKNFIKYFFKHIEFAEIQIPLNADIIDGEIYIKDKEYKHHYCVLTKEFNVLKIRKLS